jgi:hypothetical protein
MEPFDSSEISLPGLLDRGQFFSQLDIVAHAPRLLPIAVTRDASCVTFLADRTSFIALPMPDAAGPASRCGSHHTQPETIWESISERALGRNIGLDRLTEEQ